MSDYAEIGDSVIFSKPFLKSYLDELTSRASKVAIAQFLIEQKREEWVNPAQAGKLINVHRQTVVSWITEGKTLNDGTRAYLQASKKGDKNYLINRLDLENFIKLKSI